eukprot:6204913-Pleurochrysis_carterae.AAC.2
MFGRKLGRRGHGGERIIHALTIRSTGLIRAQKAKGGLVTEAEQLGFGRIASEVERVPVTSEEVLEMRFTLGALQAATEFVKVVELEEEGAVGEAGAVVGGPAEADCEPVSDQTLRARGGTHSILRQRSRFVMTMSLPRREASHSSEDARNNEVKVCQLEGKELSKLVVVEGEGFQKVTCRRASVRLHDKELPGIRRQANAHGTQRAQERVKARTMLHCDERLNEVER